MKTVRCLILVLCSLIGLSSIAKADVVVTAGCPVNLNLTYEERSALTGFYARLSHLNRHYGRTTYNARLNEILSQAWPEERVIDVSASFIEKTLNLVEQKHLENLIHQSVGLNNPKWIAFARHMRSVTLFDSGVQNGVNDRVTQDLLNEIDSLRIINRSFIPESRRRFAHLTPNELGLLKARAASAVATMYAFLGRWSLINAEITRQNARAVRQKYVVFGTVVAAGGVSVVATMYMGSIFVTTAAITAGFATDVVVAANLARITQLVVGAGIVGGGIGAPAFDIAIDNVNLHASAAAAAENNHTPYACEIEKRLAVWRERGVSPYLKTSLKGAGIGLATAGFTLHRITAKMVLGLVIPSVAVAQGNMVYRYANNKKLQGEEIRQAILAHEQGNKELAIEHLKQSRLYGAQATGDTAKSILIGALSISIAGSIKAALASDEAIGVMMANSADTLPQVAKILNEVFTESQQK